MDKYEYRLKAEQIGKLIDKQDYETAAKIADTIDWRKVKDLDMLNSVADVYEKMERYEDCMEILGIAYDRAPVGRMILYKMIEIATRMKDFPEAISLYQEFVKAAPSDQSRFILKYQIYRARGSSLEDQIKTLEEYKSHEYQEKWAYELASLYAEAGREEDCVRECDDLILWFSEGEYVVRAMELKKRFTPLTAAQQEKYARLMEADSCKDEQESDFGKTEVPAFNTGKFSTINLQAELAANLDELLREDEPIKMPPLSAGEEGDGKEPEEAGFSEIELEELKLTDEEEAAPAIELEELELPKEEDAKAIEEAFPEIELEELAWPDSEDKPESEPPEDLQDITMEEFPVPDAELPAKEEDISGIVLEEWTPLEGLEDSEREDQPPEAELEATPLPEAELPEEEPSEQAIDLPDLDNVMEPVPVDELVEKQITGQMTLEEVLAEWEMKKAQTEALLKADAGQEKARKEKVKQETAELMKLITGDSGRLPEDVKQILDEIEEEEKPKQETNTIDSLPVAQDALEEEEGEMFLEDLDEQEDAPKAPKKQKLSGDTASMNMIRDLERSLAAEVSEMAVNSGHLTKDQARLFAYFTSVKGMSKQLSVLFKEEPRTGKEDSSSGNLVVTGEPGNGKTTLAIDIVKALQKQKRLGGKKLAKISGQKLNQRDVHEILSKLKGGALIIESAGAISDATMMALNFAMEGNTGGLLIILEDSADEIGELFRRNKNFASKFDHTIDIPVFSNDELIAFGKSYALEQEYVFDEFAVLALYDRIGSRQTIDHLVTVSEVKDIVDDAIAHAGKGSLRHLIEKAARRNVDEFGHHILREEDFE